MIHRGPGHTDQPTYDGETELESKSHIYPDLEARACLAPERMSGERPSRSDGPLAT